MPDVTTWGGAPEGAHGDRGRAHPVREPSRPGRADGDVRHGRRYDDEPWGDHRTGRDEVRSYYSELMRALPDLAIEVKNRHVAPESVVLEVTIRGTHLGPWRGLPATGRRMEFPLCGIYAFDADDRLAGERIYYDRGAVLGQLGLFHEPVRGLGRVVTALSHPLTIVHAYLRLAARDSAKARSRGPA